MRRTIVSLTVLLLASSSWAMDKDDHADYVRALKAHPTTAGRCSPESQRVL